MGGEGDQELDVIVIGAGLAGLTAAHALAARGAAIHVVEARDRVGGRALTVGPPSSAGDGTPAEFDLGATWCWSYQSEIQRFAAELGVETFAQHEAGYAVYDVGEGAAPQPFILPTNPYDSLRFVGGAQVLCDRLASALGPERISLATVAREIESHRDGARVMVERGGERTHLDARFVIVALPPRLALRTLRFSPDLPPELTAVMDETPTWMGHAMKCVVLYPSAFWRERGLCGRAVSHVGPLSDIHDASTPDGAHAALFGFFAGGATARRLSPGAREARVLHQLARIYGPEGVSPLRYMELDWADEVYTSTPADALPPMDHPSYGHPLLQVPALHGRVYWAATETALEEGGYLDGAVRSGQEAARKILALAEPGTSAISP